MNKIDEIISFLKEHVGVNVDDPRIDIYDSLGVVGDDFHEMMEEYAKRYEVDMSDYLWYFHADEEGQNLGALFFPPPYSRVKRIPVSPNMLAEFMLTKKWKMDYPEHQIPKQRHDITINRVLGIFLVFLATLMMIQECG